MKKFLFSIALSAAMFCSFNAEAQTVPNWYNFQGIAAEYKSQEVAVTFEVVDEAGKAVYTETANVTTTEQGAFTHKLGTGASQDDWMFGIDWTASEYSLVVSVNGKQLCKAAFGAVPYATVAESVLGFDVQEYGELAATVKGLTAQTNDNNEAIVNLQDGLATTQEDVMNLTLGNKENKAAIADLKENSLTYSDLQNYNENVDMVYVSKETYYADQAVIEEGLATTQEDVMNLTLGNRENKAAIADLKENSLTYSDLQNYNENVDMVYVSKETYYADQAVIEEGLATTQEDVMNLTLGNKENKAAIADIKASMLTYSDLENYNENVDMVYVSKETYYADQAVIEEGLATTQEDVINLTEGNKANKAAIASLQADLANLGENIDMLPAMFENYDEQIATLEDGLSTTQEDVMNLTLGNKENKAAIAEIKETMWTYSDMENYTENLKMSFVTKEDYFANQATIEEGLDTTQQDVMNLSTANKANQSAISELQANLANLGENVDALPGMFENYDEQIANLEAEIATLKAQIATLLGE